jgi:phytoene desaturase
MKVIDIIGSGFSSLSAACYLAKSGVEVNLYEKNRAIGGRARTLVLNDFCFDMGPSWYWMPDVFESFFADFDRKCSDYYDLIKLSPAYRVYFSDSTFVDIPDNLQDIYVLFEEIEPGSAEKLRKFLSDAKYHYEVAIKDIVYKPGLSPLEMVSRKTLSKPGRFFRNISREIRNNFKSEKLIQILEFPVLFLGATPEKTPLFYSFMNHADFALGTWYPKGGMNRIVKAMESLLLELGGKIHTDSPVEEILVEAGKVTGLRVNGRRTYSEVVLSGADYNFTESLLEEKFRSYSEQYWDKRIMAPSALIYFVGLNKKVENLTHHTLFFDKDFKKHASQIYTQPAWPDDPLFYVSATSVSDPTVAPKGKECLFFLVPTAVDLDDNESVRKKYFEKIIKRFEKMTGEDISSNIELLSSYSIKDFKKDYNSYKGNAYGMANTLKQTAYFRPRIRSKKLSNLFYTGQLTVPGPGVPPALISGKIAAQEVSKFIINNYSNEVLV